ncbi:lung seven transmembrane receptor-domain-containing protein, partial [Rhizoctonia solani]
MAIVYLVLGAVWGFIAVLLSYLVGFLVIEMTATWEPVDSPIAYIKLLAGAHFASGALFAMGLFVFGFGNVSGWLLFICIVPFIITLMLSLVVIGFALYGTVHQLKERKQTYKLSIFRTLSWILILALAIVIAFIVVVSEKFSMQSEEAETWETQWYFLDAWIVILYLLVFTSIAFLWRPTSDIRRLAMSDELAQGEDTTGEYDLRLIPPADQEK